jgi:hypothetical protein
MRCYVLLALEGDGCPVFFVDRPGESAWTIDPARATRIPELGRDLIALILKASAVLPELKWTIYAETIRDS